MSKTGVVKGMELTAEEMELLMMGGSSSDQTGHPGKGDDANGSITPHRRFR